MIYEKIYDIFSEGEFPNQFSESLSERHLQKFYDLESISDNKVRFKIDRHPHAFGFSSRGMKSSAFRTITTLYELDMEKDEIIVIETETGELFINYEWLADEEVKHQFEFEYTMEWKDELQKIDSEEKAKQYAISKFEEIYIEDPDEYWFINYNSEDLPEGFKAKLLEEIKKRFINILIKTWKDKKGIS